GAAGGARSPVSLELPAHAGGRDGSSGGDLRAMAPAGELHGPAGQLVQEVLVGSLLGEDLVRVEDAGRVEYLLQAPPPADLRLAVLEGGEVALEGAETVLGGHGAAELDRVAEDLGRDRAHQVTLVLFENECRMEVSVAGVGDRRHRDAMLLRQRLE